VKQSGRSEANGFEQSKRFRAKQTVSSKANGFEQSKRFRAKQAGSNGFEQRLQLAQNQ
jgi:hypothetical protein